MIIIYSYWIGITASAIAYLFLRYLLPNMELKLRHVFYIWFLLMSGLGLPLILIAIFTAIGITITNLIAENW